MIHFERPAFLLLALIAVPLILFSWRRLWALDALRRTVAVALRTVLLVAIAVMLAEPRTVREHDHLTVIGLLDISESVRRFADVPSPPETPDLVDPSAAESLGRWIEQATQTMAKDDRFGLVVFDGQAVAISVPTTTGPPQDDLDLRFREGTNIAQAISLGLAMLPADTAKRLVLVSDGNQTLGDALDVARQGVDGASTTRIPIDILPLTYSVDREVQVVGVEAPPIAQSGQTVTVRIILQATEPTPGRLSLSCEQRLVDLNGSRPGRARALVVPAGQSVHLAQVPLPETPVSRFEAIFEPDDPLSDTLLENNRGEAFTVTPSQGKVLLVDVEEGERINPLGHTLAEAGIPVEVKPPDAMPADLLSLQRYDLIILDNVAAYQLSVRQHELISRYVHDLGGGLIMVGGRHGFGAGGWNGTAIESVLPLELDPPRQLRLPTTALVLVLDKSGSMKRSVAGARASQQQVANEAAALAIESLRADTLVAVVTFDSFPHVHVPLQRIDDPQVVADRVRGIVADGGTDLLPALRRARRILSDVEVDRKRVVCLSDGESPTSGLEELVQAMADEQIQLTTIAVGDDADEPTLKRLAELGGGKFHAVRNPRTLPRVLVDSVQMVNEPLIKEGPFTPEVRPTGSTLTAGMDQAPPLQGLVITSPREDPTVVVEMVDPDGDPLLAHWPVGLGRAAAFTSDAQGEWSSAWLNWPTAAAFWTQLARMTGRPAANLQTELRSVIRDDRLEITLDVTGDDREFLDYLQVDGVVYTPDEAALPVRLRQTAPGRYEGSVPALASGNYIVALNPRQGARRLAPAIGGASRAGSAEFRSNRSDVGVLQAIAEVSGGRQLSVADPLAVDLFDRRGMERSISSLPAWHLVLWLTLPLLLLDIASRRIAWSARQLKMAMVKAVARVAPGVLRGQQAEATLATLRRTSEQTADRLDDRTSEAARRDETPESAPAVSRSTPPPTVEPIRLKKPKATPDAKQVAAALDALLGKKRAGDEKPREAEESRGPADAPDPQQTTEQLLAAKRARRSDRPEGT